MLLFTYSLYILLLLRQNLPCTLLLNVFSIEVKLSSSGFQTFRNACIPNFDFLIVLKAFTDVYEMKWDRKIRAIISIFCSSCNISPGYLYAILACQR